MSEHITPGHSFKAVIRRCKSQKNKHAFFFERATRAVVAPRPRMLFAWSSNLADDGQARAVWTPADSVSPPANVGEPVRESFDGHFTESAGCVAKSGVLVEPAAGDTRQQWTQQRRWKCPISL
ncbi:uncharacterized protein PV09_06368 [Verruconis gallopava]|uniref:Uncharacterized protein n=1 Tax=Verruconis gallopava TaxID=253628 RepID=A0A0D2A643_9PEZI|nr:uncharacterized protein PV09_06368 [Verruconis gallopava]KIW02213.1 hypothetical protein PV09_06368 [Verruconis gallopava]